MEKLKFFMKVMALMLIVPAIIVGSIAHNSPYKSDRVNNSGPEVSVENAAQPQLNYQQVESARS